MKPFATHLPANPGADMKRATAGRFVFLATLSALLPSLSLADESVYKKALKSTVWVVQPIEREGNRLTMRTGSGSVIDARQKLILTNYHVVEEIPDVTICFPIFEKGKLVPERDRYRESLSQIGLRGRVIAKDTKHDLALIRVEGAFPPNTPQLRLAKGSPEPSERVHSIGSPGVSGALFNYTDGTVKAVYQKQWRAMRRPNDPNPLQLDARVIETSSATNQGDSGGPLMNDKCELVGVTQGASGGDAMTRSISYFIAVEEVREMLKKNKIVLSTSPAASSMASDKPKGERPMTTSGTITDANDPAKLEEEAATKLDLAKQLAAAGKTEKAKERLEEIVKKFPNTKAAEKAKQLLEKK
jgi:S1-C subfamily serine protease